MRETPYHAVLGTDFLGQTDAAADYIGRFYQRVSATIDVKALYFEMNGFEINPDKWYFNGFAYKEAGDVWPLDWLASWDGEPGEDFVLTGMESVQRAFAELDAHEQQPLAVHLAGEVAEHLVTARHMELVAAAHQRAKSDCKALRGLPVLATAHDWEIVHRTT